MDHLHRDVAGRGLAVAPASRDAFLAESVLRLLRAGTHDTRILVASHNNHVHETPTSSDGVFGLFPKGSHLAQALKDDYEAIAATGIHGRSTQIQPDPFDAIARSPTRPAPTTSPPDPRSPAGRVRLAGDVAGQAANAQL